MDIGRSGRPPVHRVLRAAADAAWVALAVAAGLTWIEAREGSWLTHGLRQLVPLGFADHARDLLRPALLVAGALLAFELALRGLLRRRRRGAAAALVLAAAAGAAALAAHDRLVPWLLGAWPAAGQLLAEERLRWTLLGPLPVALVVGAVAALAAGRLLAGLRRRGARPRLPWLGATLAGLAVAGLLGGAAWDRAGLRSAPGDDVVLIVLDTVAALHLASHGHPRDTMPELEAWAARGRSYPEARSVAPWTLPSHASFFTGLLPIEHGATQEHVALAEHFDTLAERLRARGYRTFAAVGNGVVGHHSQLDQGFARFVPTWRSDVVQAWGRGERHVNEEALLRFVDGLGPDEHFFAFLNYIDAHSPYEPPRSLDARMGVPPGAREIDQDWRRYYAGRNPLGPAQFAALGALYDGGLAALSRNLDSLLRALEARGRLEHTLVIVTSDHGENVGEHGQLDHVFSLNETLLRVPLLLVGAGVEGPAADPRTATNLDVAATVLAAGGLAHPGIDGFDLRHPGPAPRRTEVAEYYYPGQVLAAMGPVYRALALPRIRPYLRRMRAIEQDGWKLIWGSDGHDALYHLADDPGEEVDLAAREPQRVAAMKRTLEARLRERVGTGFSLGGEPPPAGAAAGFEAVDDATREQLRALGYAD